MARSGAPAWLGQVGRHATLPPPPLAGLSVGELVRRPSQVQVTVDSLGALLSADATEPAVLLAGGGFDLGFIVVAVLPLLLLAVTYDVVSAERERGTWALILAQPVDPSLLVLAKVAVRAGVVVGTVLGATALGLGLTGTDLTDRSILGRLLGWAMSVGLYSAFGVPGHSRERGPVVGDQRGGVSGRLARGRRRRPLGDPDDCATRLSHACAGERSSPSARPRASWNPTLARSSPVTMPGIRSSVPPADDGSPTGWRCSTRSYKSRKSACSAAHPVRGATDAPGGTGDVAAAAFTGPYGPGDHRRHRRDRAGPVPELPPGGRALPWRVACVLPRADVPG